MVVSGEVKNVVREYKGSVGLTIDSHQRITYGDLSSFYIGLSARKKKKMFTRFHISI